MYHTQKKAYRKEKKNGMKKIQIKKEEYLIATERILLANCEEPTNI